jgi:hypothetical protein
MCMQRVTHEGDEKRHNCDGRGEKHQSGEDDGGRLERQLSRVGGPKRRLVPASSPPRLVERAVERRKGAQQECHFAVSY